MNREERRRVLASKRGKPRDGIVHFWFKPPLPEEFEETMVDRMSFLNLLCNDYGWMFLNPIAIAVSKERSHQFFLELRRLQAEWFRRSRGVFPRPMRQSVKAWQSHERGLTKYQRYLRRTLCLTGLVIGDGKILPSHELKRYEQAAKEAWLKPVTSEPKTET